MMGMNSTVIYKGLGELEHYIKMEKEQIKKKKIQAGKDIGELLKAYITQRMTSSPANTSVEYRARKTKTRKHHPSHKGEYPRPDMSELVHSIGYKIIQQDRKLVLQIGSLKATTHAAYLEFKDSEKGGRPWLRRACNEKAKEIDKKFMGVMGKVSYKTEVGN